VQAVPVCSTEFRNYGTPVEPQGGDQEIRGQGVKRFTTRWIESVKVEKRTDFTDPDLKGLVLRVTPNGAKSWAYLYRRKSDGRRRRVTLGEFPRVGLQEARATASGHRAEVAVGADPALLKSAARKVETVDQMFDRFLSDYSAPGPRWRAEMRRVLAHDVRPAIGAYKIDKVSKADIIALLNTIRDRGAGVQANRALQVVRTAFNWAVSEDYLVVSPASRISERVKEEPRSRALSEAEIRSFWRGLDDARMTPAAKLVLRIALVTGQRIGEICGAEKLELNWNQGEWIIPAKRVKNRREHSVPLSPLALNLFREAIILSGGSRFVFPSRSRSGSREQPLTSHSLGHAVRKALVELGLSENPATPHDLRRTMASQMAAMGIGENIVARVLNHASEIGKTITGAVYIRHSFAAEKRHALEAWATELERMVTAGPAADNVVKIGRLA
jgi:integrase